MQRSYVSWGDLVPHLESKEANERNTVIVGVSEINHTAETEDEV